MLEQFLNRVSVGKTFNLINRWALVHDRGLIIAKRNIKISYKDEIKKLSPILKKLPKEQFIISVDSSKIETQEFALENGAHIINDIFGGSDDLFQLTKKYKNGLVLMHTPAPPKIMQSKVNSYKNVVNDIRKIF